MAEVQRVPANTSIDEIIETLDRDAALIIEDVLSQEQIEQAFSELQPHLDGTREGNNEFSGFNTKRMGALLARSELARELAVHPTINATCDRVLKEFADGYQLHFTQAVSIGPGETAQALHRDRGLWGGYIPRRIETQVSTIWAISEFTEENGATLLVPGSHTWDNEREPLPEEIVSAEMKPGSVLLYTGTVIHGGGTNRSKDQWRTGMLIHYTLNWLRQEENQYLSCPPEIAKELSPELRALIGYSRGNGVLGFYSSPTQPGEGGYELADPKRLFE